MAFLLALSYTETMAFTQLRPLVFLGYGGVARCLLPLLDRHFSLPVQNVVVIEPRDVANALQPYLRRGAQLVRERLTAENYRTLLERWVPRGALLIDLSVNCDTDALVTWCQARGACYVNASVEYWNPGTGVGTIRPQDRTLYPRHEAFRARREAGGGPTAVLDHGVNPGLVSHFVKAALVDLAEAQDHLFEIDKGFGVLARDLGVKVIHIAEKDGQLTRVPRHIGEFVNTWSVEGFIEESLAPAELGWGTHETDLPPRAFVHEAGPRHQIGLAQPGFKTKVRTWVPSGPTLGMVIRHGEAHTITEALSVPGAEGEAYRPTVHYAYHCNESAQASLAELEARRYRPQTRHRILADEIVGGTDELGVLLMGHGKRSWWYGSELDIAEARRLVPGQNATTVQVAAGLAAAILWIEANPDRGVLVPDDLPWRDILAVAKPFLGRVTSRAVDWSPADDPADRDLFGRFDGRGASVAGDDEWQFTTFLVD